ncbi:MAG: hypothetical protein MRY83_22550 [Flavobacteriales bacterium]|nr:hypothetical protein [Flavobacteriales bacterium]
MRKLIIFFAAFCSINGFSQTDSLPNKELSRLTLGIRTTTSFFDHHDYNGAGYGGHFRIRVSDQVNTEWFADYIKTDIGGLGLRETYHIGWSVLFYMNKQKADQKFAPYFAAGHCFDHAIVSANRLEDGDRPSVKRWTSAVQGGIGTHYYLTRNFNLTLSALYMSHLGKDLHVEVSNHHNEPGTETEQPHLIISDSHSTPILEGHLLISLSVNYRFSKL